MKYTRPKECNDCSLANKGIFQKIYKVKITTDLRRYIAPAHGSKAWGQPIQTSFNSSTR
ncbi:putative transposase [Tetragenococcus halophilus NBRC 12172]|uniref:Transposase n=1 Tax=Tetragenococcus halophilus (strain DSM 20338 / JCM 20259 / NCIMB 9735 / NBRC 12172) TaxID=945021 RepID=A0AAN1VPZ1_TETHN|nr:putative transposase [Tetragenococcus halophilus NBRC 12172]